MPIIFENRLGNSESDMKLRKIYGLHHKLWILYYSIFFAGCGLGLAILVGQNSNPIVAILIMAVTIGMIFLFIKRQTYRTRRR